MAAQYKIEQLSEGSGSYVEDIAGEALGKHSLVYRDASNHWRLADADDATKMPILGLTLEAIASGSKGRVLLSGYVADTAWAWTVGGPNAVIYASATPGALTQTAPALVRVIGTAYSATSIMFSPEGVGGLGGNDPETEADYIIWTDGATPATYYAKNGHTGQIDFSGADADVLINQVVQQMRIEVKRGAIHLKEGMYNIDHSIILYNGIWLTASVPGWSDGSTAIIGAVLKCSAAMNEPAISIVGEGTYTQYDWFAGVQNIVIFGSNTAVNTLNHGILIKTTEGINLDVYLLHPMIIACGGSGIKSDFGGKLWVEGGYAETNLEYGLYLYRCSGGWHVKNMYIYGNTLGGIRTEETTNKGSNIEGNQIRILNGSAGIIIYSGAKSGIISGNGISGISGTTTGIDYQVNDDYKKWIIEGNIFNNLTYGITMRKGSYWGALTPEAIITSNWFNIVTNPIYSTDWVISNLPNIIIHNNQGYITESSGTASIPMDGASTYVVVPHGLSITPTQIDSQPKEAAGINQYVPNANVDATNFRIYIPAPVAASAIAVTKAVADDGGVQTNETTPANNATANDMTLLPAVPAANDAYYFGGAQRFGGVRVDIGTQGVGVWTAAWEYWNGTAWTALAGVVDGTVAFTAAAGAHDVTFTIPTGWQTTTVSATLGYYVRCRVATYTSVVTTPIGTQSWLLDALHYFWRAASGSGN